MKSSHPLFSSEKLSLNLPGVECFEDLDNEFTYVFYYLNFGHQFLMYLRQYYKIQRIFFIMIKIQLLHNCNKKKSNFYLFYLFFKLIYFVVYFIMRHTDRYKLIIKITSAISKQLAASFFDYELLEIQLSFFFLGLLRQLRAFFFICYFSKSSVILFYNICICKALDGQQVLDF